MQQQGLVTNTRLAQAYGFFECDTMDDVSRRDVQDHAAEKWDTFYRNNQNHFFKDRHWLTREFPCLLDVNNKVIGELGCGVGNSTFPLLKECPKETIFYCTDFAEQAVECLKQHASYDRDRIVQCFVSDISCPEQVVADHRIVRHSCHVCLLIFVLSAMPPSRMHHVVTTAYQCLLPGGRVLLRDYARGDATQLKFARNKASRTLEANLCVRGDGTQAYFFELDELKDMWEKEGKFRAELMRVVETPPTHASQEEGLPRKFVQAEFVRL